MSLCALPVRVEVAKGYIHEKEAADMETICIEISLIALNDDYNTFTVTSINQAEL